MSETSSCIEYHSPWISFQGLSMHRLQMRPSFKPSAAARLPLRLLKNSGILLAEPCRGRVLSLCAHGILVESLS
jgi:hypothetical protein